MNWSAHKVHDYCDAPQTSKIIPRPPATWHQHVISQLNPYITASRLTCKEQIDRRAITC